MARRFATIVPQKRSRAKEARELDPVHCVKDWRTSFMLGVQLHIESAVPTIVADAKDLKVAVRDFPGINTGMTSNGRR
jgi:hypothetical protein